MPHCSAWGIAQLWRGWGECRSYQVEDEPSLVWRRQHWSQEQQDQKQAEGRRLGHGGLDLVSAAGPAGAL